MTAFAPAILARYTSLPAPNKPEYGAAYYTPINGMTQWVYVWYRSYVSPDKVWIIYWQEGEVYPLLVSWERVQEGKYDALRSAANLQDMPFWAVREPRCGLELSNASVRWLLTKRRIGQ